MPNLNRQVDVSNATDRRKTGRTALYRIWGEAGQLLYIGISNDFGRRWKEHAKQQPWWAEMRRLAVDEWLDSRKAAQQAEEAAIKAEGPKYNKRHAAAPGPQPETRSIGPRLGAAQPFRECHCRDAQTGKKLHRNCPRLADKDHGAWYARYTVPRDALDWNPARSRTQRTIGPFASKREAADELADLLHGYARAGLRVAHLPPSRAGSVQAFQCGTTKTGRP